MSTITVTTDEIERAKSLIGKLCDLDRQVFDVEAELMSMLPDNIPPPWVLKTGREPGHIWRGVLANSYYDSYFNKIETVIIRPHGN